MLITIYIIGLLLNLVLAVSEEFKVKEPVWRVIIMSPSDKSAWFILLDKLLFVGLSWLSYFIYGLIFYFRNWGR